MKRVDPAGETATVTKMRNGIRTPVDTIPSPFSFVLFGEAASCAKQIDMPIKTSTTRHLGCSLVLSTSCFVEENQRVTCSPKKQRLDTAIHTQIIRVYKKCSHLRFSSPYLFGSSWERQQRRRMRLLERLLLTVHWPLQHSCVAPMKRFRIY